VGTCGALLVVLFAAASARIPLDRYFPSAGITVDFVKMLGPGWERPTVHYVGLVTISFALYATALWVVWRHGLPDGSRKWVLAGFPVLFALALLPMYPPTAMDMFHYHAMGRVLWVHGANPLTTPQGLLPYPIGMSWADLPSPYGPLWSVLAGPASRLPGDNYIAALLGFKAMGAAAYLGCTWVIWVLVRRTRPGDETLAAVLFAWNPFVLLRVVGNGHNDLWMMLFVLLALERAERRAWTSSILLLSASVLVKYATALLGLPLLLYIWTYADGSPRERATMLGTALLTALFVTVAIYAPFWSGIDTFSVRLNETARMITSTPVLLQLFLGRYLDANTTLEYARLIPRIVFLALYVPLVWQARRGFDHLVVVSFTALFLYLLVAASWFRPWYMLWPAALAALRPREWLGATFLAITVASSFPDIVEQFRNYWPIIAPYDRAIAAPIVLAFLPPAAVWLLGVLQKRGWSLGARTDAVGGADSGAPSLASTTAPR
jgi:hypothetical protein